jgi:hypothetical protein
MKKICLTLVGIYMMMLHAYSQFQTKDAATYESKPLKIDEINLVSSYYTQDGNHSPITGGIGTEKVTDFSNGLDVKWIGWDARQRKHTLTAGLGYDHHSSASSAFVNKSGASKIGGSRIYPSLNWSVENEQKGTGFGLGAYYSTEYNYKSFGLDAEFTKKTKNNGEFNVKLTGYFDKVKQILPHELIPLDTVTTATGIVYITTASGREIPLNSSGGTKRLPIPSKPRNTITSSFTFSQVINTRLQGSVLLDLVYQGGDLGLPFHRVYWNDGTVHVENLPSQRFKLPIGLRLNYFLGDKIILRSYYRYYTDSWGLQSHTASLEVPVKITPFLSISPFYRFYNQTAIKYFAAYQKHTAQDQYYTSNYDLSKFNSNFFGAGIRIAPPKGVFGMQHLNMIELRYGHYTKNIDMNSDIISMNLKFK